jgi:spermidine synthase
LGVACAGLALTGFAALLGEVAFIRFLSLVLGNSPYAFTLIVAAYVLGIGVGSQWLSSRNPPSDSLRLFGFLQLGLVAAVSIAVPLYARLPLVFWKLSYALNHTYATWSLYQLVTFSVSLVVVGLPAFLLGAAFPCGARAATSQARALGRGLGRAYLWNTLGTVAGAGLGGLFLLPWLGLEGVFALVLVAHLVAAALALVVAASPGGRLRGAGWIAAAALAMTVCMISERGWSTFVASLGAFRFRDPPPSSYSELRNGWAQHQTPLFHQDDAGASVVVVQHRETGTRAMRVNGKADASNDIDTGTQILVGQLGLLMHPRDVKRVLVVGLGSGITVSAVLSHPVERVDVVELSPAVVQASHFFDQDNHNVLNDPRLRLHLEDAKTFLALADGKYDLVISEPSNPWTAGSASLFTRDFFQRVSEHMTDDGILVQWCHTYENATPLIQLVVRTLRETFPHAVTWAGTEDILFIASRQPLVPNWNELVRRMDRPAAKADLARAGIDDPYTLLALQAQSDEGQGRFAGAGPINTDDLNLLEFAAPIAFYADSRAVLSDERRRPGAQPLWIQSLAPGGLTAARAQAIHAALVRIHRADAALIQSVAERWLELAPDSDEATEAVAEAALARRDLGAAQNVLQARVRAGSRAPRLLADYFQLLAAQTERSRSLFQPTVDASAVELAAWARQNLKDQPEVQTALDRFDGAQH